jgi:type IV secretory pathway VirB2 component (pilin)
MEPARLMALLAEVLVFGNFLFSALSFTLLLCFVLLIMEILPNPKQISSLAGLSSVS